MPDDDVELARLCARVQQTDLHAVLLLTRSLADARPKQTYVQLIRRAILDVRASLCWPSSSLPAGGDSKLTAVSLLSLPVYTTSTHPPGGKYISAHIHTRHQLIPALLYA